jgi:tRNA A37 N6-isopentenylltransferase MiaA
MAAGGVVEEARSAWQGPLSETARRVLGVEQFATLPLAQALEETTVATLRLARYQRKWLRRLTPVATLPADRQPGVIADEIVTLAGTRKRLSRL